MMGITHAGFAAASWTVVAGLFGFPTDVVLAGSFVAIGAGVAPDLDEPQSSAARSFGVAGRAGLSAARKAGGYRHRGPLTHSLVASVGAGAVVAAGVATQNQTVTTVIVTLFTMMGFGVFGGRKHRSRGVIVGVAAAAATAWVLLQVVAVGWWLTVAVTTGWAAHVIGDMIVGSSGVPALWPLTRSRLALGVMKVGGVVELSVVMPAVYIGWALAAAATLDVAVPLLP